MRNCLTNLVTAATVLVAAAPAYASGGTSVPEPNTITVLSLAMAGVLIGRRMAKGRPGQD